MKTFYNSQLSFAQRRYEALGVALSPIHLPQPLDHLLNLPLLPFGGRTPPACFRSLTRCVYLWGAGPVGG